MECFFSASFLLIRWKGKGNAFFSFIVLEWYLSWITISVELYIHSTKEMNPSIQLMTCLSLFLRRETLTAEALWNWVRCDNYMWLTAALYINSHSHEWEVSGSGRICLLLCIPVTCRSPEVSVMMIILVRY